MNAIPRVVISAPSSGHGKTAVAVGLLAAFSALGYRCAGFKIGPDHVDASYLGLAAGRPGRNLDPRLVGAGRMGPLFAYGAGSLDIAVVEGTMGLFDGLAGRTDTESTAQISGLLRAPVVLVIDVGAMGQSVAALVHGFRAYDELLWLGGVILNRVASSRHEQLLREALDDIGVPVLGALRRRALTEIGDVGAPLPSRQHGVAPVTHGSLDAVRAVRRLGEVISSAVDVERTMALARSAPRLSTDPWSAEDEVIGSGNAAEVVAATRAGHRPVVAVAYAYPETSELLRAAGADVVVFDPLREEALPPGVDGIVVGAALPEAYAEELSFNGRMRAAVAAHAAAGKPIVAEGTGLVWLCQDYNGRPMTGVLGASARSTDMVVLGYREATARSSSILFPSGAEVVGHKMHRTTVAPRSGVQPAWSWAGGPAEGFVARNIHASYLGLHWAGIPEVAARFVAAARAAAPPAIAGQWAGPDLSAPSAVFTMPDATYAGRPVPYSALDASSAAAGTTAVTARVPTAATEHADATTVPASSEGGSAPRSPVAAGSGSAAPRVADAAPDTPADAAVSAAPDGVDSVDGPPADSGSAGEPAAVAGTSAAMLSASQPVSAASADTAVASVISAPSVQGLSAPQPVSAAPAPVGPAAPALVSAPPAPSERDVLDAPSAVSAPPASGGAASQPVSAPIPHGPSSVSDESPTETVPPVSAPPAWPDEPPTEVLPHASAPPGPRAGGGAGAA